MIIPIQLLLVDDVDQLGRSGDLVTVKPGYARNYLLPKKKAVTASKQTLRLQVRLQEERAKRAAVDRQASEELAARLQGFVLEIEVKVDPEGHMYGWVSATDIVKLFSEKGVEIEKRHVLLAHPLKDLGVHNLSLRLNEGVMMPFVLKVNSDVPLPQKKRSKRLLRKRPQSNLSRCRMRGGVF